MLNKHTIKAAANANASRSQYKPVRCGLEWEDWTQGKTHTKVDSMMFSRVIYICNARAQNFSKRQRKLALRFSVCYNPSPSPPSQQIFGQRLLSCSKSLVRCEREGSRGVKERGKSCLSWKVAGACWVAWLPAWAVIWGEQTSPTSAKMVLLLLRMYVCVCDVWAKQAIMIMPKFVRLQTTKSTISNAVPERGGSLMEVVFQVFK